MRLISIPTPHNGRQGWIHAREHGDLSEDRGGAGDEVTGSAVEGLSGEDQVVAGGGVDGDQLAADASMAEATGRARPQGLAGPSARYTEPPARAEGEGGTGSEPNLHGLVVIARQLQP